MALNLVKIREDNSGSGYNNNNNNNNNNIEPLIVNNTIKSADFNVLRSNDCTETIIVYYLLHHIFFMVLESNSLWVKSLRAAVNSVKD